MKKNIILAILLLGSLVLFYTSATKVMAVTIEELQQQIQALLELIRQLMSQQASTQITTTTTTTHRGSYCFFTDLHLGVCSNEVTNLQIILGVQPVSGCYDYNTFLAVQEFQKENGITPTGYVGPLTRTALNSKYCVPVPITSPVKYSCTTAYGTIYENQYPVCIPSPMGTFNSLKECEEACGIKPITPSVRIISPNGGEKLKMGETYDIKWTTSEISSETEVTIDLVYTYADSKTPLEAGIATQIKNTGIYKWTIPTSGIIADIITKSDPNAFRLRIFVPSKPGVEDSTDGYFSISPPLPLSVLSCNDQGITYYRKFYLDMCRIQGYDKVCFDKYTGEYQGCGRFSYNNCTLNNVNAYRNIWCDVSPTTNPQPDLIITGIVLSSPGTNPKVGDTYAYFDVKIKNIGNAIASPSSNIYGGLDILCSLNHYPTTLGDPNNILVVTFTQPLSPNSAFTSYRTNTIAETPLLTTAGNKHIYCTIDPNNKIAESNENNNNYDFWITVNPNNVTCTDSDGGYYPYTKGIVNYGGQLFIDTCLNGYCPPGQPCFPSGSYMALSEYFCENGMINSTTFICPTGYTCIDGACRQASITVTSPSGAITLLEGNDYVIKWDASNLPNDAKINIQIYRSDGSSLPIAQNLPPTQREYVWKVTASGNWGLGYNYKPPLLAKILGFKRVEANNYSYQIQVAATWGIYESNYYGSVSDRSEGWFYISSSAPPTTIETPVQSNLTNPSFSQLSSILEKLSASLSDLINLLKR